MTNQLQRQPEPSTTSRSMGRRYLLKAGAWLAAAGAGLSRTWARDGQSGEVESAASNTVAGADSSSGSGELRRGMIAFDISHEQFPVEKLAVFGPAAELAGFDMLAASDHLQPWQADEGHAGQAWVTLSNIGAHTNHIKLGTTVTCPILRYNPAVVAEAFASLNRLYPGRVYLALGSGEALNEEAATGQWPSWSERWARLIEAVSIIRQLWTGEMVSFRGKYYTVNARLYDPPVTPIPLLLAANGPNAIKLAGQYGDGLVTDPMTWKQYKSEWESAAAAAGKNPADMPVLVEQFVVVGGLAEAEIAARLWNFEPKAFKGYENIPSPAQIEQDAASQIPLDQVYSQWVVSTDPAAHIETIRELQSSGVWVVNIHSGQPHQLSVIEFYGREVFPQLRKP